MDAEYAALMVVVVAVVVVRMVWWWCTEVRVSRAAVIWRLRWHLYGSLMYIA